MAKTHIKRASKKNSHLETDYATAVRLLKEARVHLGYEMFGDARYCEVEEGWTDEPATTWFADVDKLIGPAFPGGGVNIEQPVQFQPINLDVDGQFDDDGDDW